MANGEQLPDLGDDFQGGNSVSQEIAQKAQEAVQKIHEQREKDRESGIKFPDWASI